MTPEAAEKSLKASARSLFIVMERSETLEERVAALEQRIESMLMERFIVGQLRREDAARIVELEERLCEATR